MKMKRLLASVLALLLMVSLLPIGVMAKDNTEDNRAIGESIDTNSGNNVLVQEGSSVQTNTGRNVAVEEGGTVVINAKGGEIKTNNGTVGEKDKDGNVVDGTGNSGTIKTNNGTVITNNKGGTVENNATDGEIETNNGTVGEKDKDGNAVAGTGNYGTIETNNGTVITNNEGGTVETNAKGGEIETSNGTVGDFDECNSALETAAKDCKTFEEFAAAVAGIELETGNFGTITDNKGDISYNGTDGFIETNNGYVGLNNGTVKTNNSPVGLNNGTVETNNVDVELNNGTVETNNWYVQLNYGTVETNYELVGLNNGTVETNNGGVSQNIGTVVTNNGGVSQNIGTVETNAIDGVVNNYRTESKEEGNNNDADSSKEEPVVLQGTVEYNFGTVYDFTECVKGDDKPTIYYGLSWGENTDHLNLIDGAVKAETEKNLDEIARSVNNSGYRMTGYTAYYREDGKDIKIEETNRYTMKAPTWLKILWEKIVTAVESHEPEAKPEKKTSIPTSLSADQVKVGAYVRQGNLLFRIIEVNDDSIRVVIVGKLSEQALADMLGFLKQHLSDAQIAKINGEPALLEQELVTYFFGGTFEHISFYAAPDLFA